ncbi:MAG: VWA domain-containing protein [Gammaproteobacteria bacterium]|jgi:polyhydroxyalkanoate synthesis regulator phasin|nr:VWA domain-containing protein [Gammaproteobacteria bacterium]MBT3860896.1 VWA domain-containing protein [Gammaproteobacteria bacterium]MBT3988419.1 VWA domain-containing protein [Gammaproteobacteria bacterium]MBT4255974.1 VWA domain-containing protein [Gammaproteobacteria bacterium]MBT4581478.1 VWA domain-containing protein [Gammaproteobacteria bacterium]
MASNKKKRRNLDPLSLSFLDVMFCGFGAVILIFLILDHTSTVADVISNPDITAEINLLEEEVLEGELGLVALRNTFSDTNFEVVTAQGLARRIQEQIETFLQELAALENSSVATVDSVEKLRADVEALEEELLRLQASAFEEEGNSVRQFMGDGNRQYLSGLFLGGQRILILVDSSASMLDSTLVNIIRTRNMPVERKLQAPKWQRVIKTVDWISTQLPITSQYQLWNFSDSLSSLASTDRDAWQEVADRDQLNAAVESVKTLVPANGTNMEQVFRAVANMSPLPDNIFLITDGLPTISDRGSSDALVTPARRLELYEDAVEELPNGVPVNVVLMPLEGDPSAAAAYWQLAQYTRGSFLTPSKDWP